MTVDALLEIRPRLPDCGSSAPASAASCASRLRRRKTSGSVARPDDRASRDADRLQRTHGAARSPSTRRAANEQHYEVPAAFFELVLGPRLKYSACLLRDSPATTLAEAEEAMLRLTCERAELRRRAAHPRARAAAGAR